MAGFLALSAFVGKAQGSGIAEPFPEQRRSSATNTFTYAEQMPTFRGNLSGFLSGNIKYPEDARINGIEGRVIIKFVVDETGRVVDTKVVRSVYTALDSEALRVVKLMPRWEPGMQGGKPVKVFFPDAHKIYAQ